MTINKPVKVVFGAGSVGDTIAGDDVKTVLDLFRKHGHVELDTAATYPINNFGASEKALGQQDLSWASVSTKVSAMKDRANSPENVRKGLDASQKQLNGKEIDVYYFHMPDAVTPMEEQAAAMDEAFRAGKFKRFGISNFSPQHIEELMEIVERKGKCHWLVLPGTAQSNSVRIRQAERAPRTVQLVRQERRRGAAAGPPEAWHRVLCVLVSFDMSDTCRVADMVQSRSCRHVDRQSLSRIYKHVR